MTDSSMLKFQYDSILDQLLMLQGHAESPDCPCSLQGTHPGELGEYCEPKHLRTIVALAKETITMEEDTKRIDYLTVLVMEGSELLGKMENKLCDREVDLGDYMTWCRDKRKPLEDLCYSGFCNIKPAEEAIVEEVAQMFKKKAEPRWCPAVKETDSELGKLSRTLGTAKKRITELQKHLEMPLNICRGQAELFEAPSGVLDPYGSRCRDQETGQWSYSEECGFEPAGITTTALGMDGITHYEFEFKIISLDKLIVSHDPFTFTPNPDYPEELQPRIRERAATKIQVEKIAANLEPEAVITDFHVIDRGTPIVGPDLVVEAGNGRVMGITKAAADYPEKYAEYKDRLRERAHDYGLSAKDIDSIDNPVLIRVRITDVDRIEFAQEANQAATIAPSAIENARTDAQNITMGMLQQLVVGENESLEDALRAPKNQAFAKRFLSTLSENVQASLVDAQGYLNRDGVHRMAMGIFVSAFQGDSGLRLAEKAFESVDMDVRNTVNAIARSLGTMAQAESLTRSGERDTGLSIGDDLAQTVNVYSAIKRNPSLTVDKYLAQEQIFARELTPFQEDILKVLNQYRSSPKKLGGIFTAYAAGVIAAPPPAQGSLIPGVAITKEGLWESAVNAPDPQPALMEVIKMFPAADISQEMCEVAKLFAPMKLLTKEIRDKLPPLYSQEEVADPIVQVKFFTPDSNWTWYVIEGSAILDDGTQVEASYADRNLRDVRGRSEEGEVQESTGKDDLQFAEAVSKLVHSFNEAKGLLSNEGSGQSDVARRADGEPGVSVPVKARSSQSEQSWLREESQPGTGEEDRQVVGEGGAGAPQGRRQDERRAGEFGAEDSERSPAGAHEGKEEGERPVRKVVDYLFFGWVVGFEKELGYFTLKELESARGPMGLAIERDKWFKPAPLSEVKKLHEHEAGGLGEARNALTVFASLIPSDTDSMEVSVSEEDLSGTITAIVRGKRMVSLTFQRGESDGNVYDWTSDIRAGVYRKTGGDLAQGTIAAIGSAVITGIGIGAGFKLIDWLASTFSKRDKRELEAAAEPPLSKEEQEELTAVGKALDNAEVINEE